MPAAVSFCFTHNAFIFKKINLQPYCIRRFHMKFWLSTFSGKPRQSCQVRQLRYFSCQVCSFTLVSGLHVTGWLCGLWGCTLWVHRVSWGKRGLKKSFGPKPFVLFTAHTTIQNILKENLILLWTLFTGKGLMSIITESFHVLRDGQGLIKSFGVVLLI